MIVRHVKCVLTRINFRSIIRASLVSTSKLNAISLVILIGNLHVRRYLVSRKPTTLSHKLRVWGITSLVNIRATIESVYPCILMAQIGYDPEFLCALVHICTLNIQLVFSSVNCTVPYRKCQIPKLVLIPVFDDVAFSL